MASAIDGAKDELALMAKAGLPVQAQAVAAAFGALDPYNARKLREPAIIHATIVHLGPAIDSRAPAEALHGIAVLETTVVPPEWPTLRNQSFDIARRVGLKRGGERPHLPWPKTARRSTQSRSIRLWSGVPRTFS